MRNESKTKDIIMKIIMALLIAMIIFIICIDIFFYVYSTPGNMFIKATQRALIVKVGEYDLGTVLLNDDHSFGEEIDLCNISFGKNGNIGFKPGQEILVYYSGIILQMAPCQLSRSV